MLNKLKKHIKDNLFFLQSRKILVAVSGGVDSVVLLNLFHRLNYNVVIAHCNFKLRGEQSDLDQDFVKGLSEAYQLESYFKEFDTTLYAKENKVSIQLAARELRYKWFKEIAYENKFDFVLTAHHADDNLETFLINLSRGTGIKGLIGIPEKNGIFVRPLLPFSKEEIKLYAVNNDLLWREDNSNAGTKYLRNKIRHQIIPFFKQVNNNLLDNFTKSVENLKQSSVIIEDRISKIKKESVFESENVLKLKIADFLEFTNPKAYLYEVLNAYGFTQWDDIVNLLTAQSGKFLKVNGYTLLKDRGFLILKSESLGVGKDSFLISKDQTIINYPVNLKIEKKGDFNKKSKKSIIISKNLVIFPLILRKWEEGDFFYPVGMKGKKKLSKYFKDEKYSLFEKKETWILCTKKNEIIWILGKRQDRRFLGTAKVENNIKITLI